MAASTDARHFLKISCITAARFGSRSARSLLSRISSARYNSSRLSYKTRSAYSRRHERPRRPAALIAVMRVMPVERFAPQHPALEQRGQADPVDRRAAVPPERPPCREWSGRSRCCSLAYGRLSPA